MYCLRNKILELEHFCHQENVQVLCVPEPGANFGNLVPNEFAVKDIFLENKREMEGRRGYIVK